MTTSRCGVGRTWIPYCLFVVTWVTSIVGLLETGTPIMNLDTGSWGLPATLKRPVVGDCPYVICLYPLKSCSVLPEAEADCIHVDRGRRCDGAGRRRGSRGRGARRA